MRIAITRRNAARIEAALGRVNGRAATHTCISFDDVEDMANESEAHMRTGTRLALREMSGARAVLTSGHGVPVSYNGVPITTTLTIERGSRDWFLIDVRRSGGTRAPVYAITERQRDAVIARLDREFRVLPEAAVADQ